ncbi:MAG: hypothetical protein J0651_05150, partial [Actinobacteria bacterium]|nr:hypothetical protein [Actinomycetota bacterium]
KGDCLLRPSFGLLVEPSASRSAALGLDLAEVAPVCSSPNRRSLYTKGPSALNIIALPPCLGGMSS